MVRDLADGLFVESLRLLSLTELPRSFTEDGRLGVDQEGPLSEWRLAWARFCPRSALWAGRLIDLT